MFMPVRKCSNGKYRIGSGQCMYKSKASAERAYKGYLGHTYGESLIAAGMIRAHTEQLFENIQADSLNYGNIVDFIESIRAVDPNNPDQGGIEAGYWGNSEALDRAFNTNDMIVFLGSLGSRDISGYGDFGFDGGDRDTEIPDLAADPNIAPGVGGYASSGGAIRFPTDVWTRMIQGQPSLSDANATVHELMHRGFYMLSALVQQYPEIRNYLPSDLFDLWFNGWGTQQNIPDTSVRMEDGSVQDMQITPEHAMIYSMTTQPGGFHDRIFLRTLPQVAWAQRFFTQEWHQNFSSNYADMTRNAEPNGRHDRIRTYWRILYSNTEQGIANFFRQELAYAPAQAGQQGRPTRPRARPSDEPEGGEAYGSGNLPRGDYDSSAPRDTSGGRQPTPGLGMMGIILRNRGN